MNREPEHLPTPDELAFAERWMETVDRAARGELDGEELDRLEAAARANPALREALDDARALRPHFARMAELSATDALDERILGATVADSTSRPNPTRHIARRAAGPRPRRAIPAWSWTAVAAAAVVLLVWALPVGIDDPDGETPLVAQQYSDAEVQAAAEEVELALAVLGQTMQRTSRRLQQEMVTGVRGTLDHSFRQGFGRTLNEIPYLNRSSQDEEHSGIFIPPRDGMHRTLGVALPGERT